MKIGISSNLINKSMNEMPKCPNCKNEMVIVWYSEPDEFIEECVKNKKIFYRGLELKEIDKNDLERITYHCYNCDRSYSKNLKIYKIEKEIFFPYDEIDKLINKITFKIIAKLSEEEINYLKLNSEYNHFGFGLYIRNNYIYNNKDIKYRLDVNSFAKKIFDRIIEKISS